MAPLRGARETKPNTISLKTNSHVGEFGTRNPAGLLYNKIERDEEKDTDVEEVFNGVKKSSNTPPPSSDFACRISCAVSSSLSSLTASRSPPPPPRFASLLSLQYPLSSIFAAWFVPNYTLSVTSVLRAALREYGSIIPRFRASDSTPDQLRNGEARAPH
jgi:hypothetical protein